jgi:hypothetical protein
MCNFLSNNVVIADATTLDNIFLLGRMNIIRKVRLSMFAKDVGNKFVNNITKAKWDGSRLEQESLVFWELKQYEYH